MRWPDRSQTRKRNFAPNTGSPQIPVLPEDHRLRSFFGMNLQKATHKKIAGMSRPHTRFDTCASETRMNDMSTPKTGGYKGVED